MKAYTYLFGLILMAALLTALAAHGVVGAEEAPLQETPLEEAIVGIWSFPVDGYYMGFDADGRLCYGGSEASVAAKRWCNQYTVADGIVTETCMGGPEDRNCPLGGGSCQAKVSIGESGNLTYRILREQCDMLQYKVVPPRQYTFTRP